MGKFDGKVALITGGARGQGRSHAIAFAREGASIVVCDIAEQIDTVPYTMADDDQLAETAKLVEEHGQRCLALKADVRDTAAVARVVDETMSEFGRIDILIANHGVISLATVADMTDVFKTMRAVIPHMLEQGWGRIIATASMAGRTGLPAVAHYCAAKWGVIGLCKSVAREVAERGITLNCVCLASEEARYITGEALHVAAGMNAFNAA